MISSRATNLPPSRTRRISRSIGMRSMCTGFPPRVSSYRLMSKTNCPSWTISEGMEAPHKASYGHSTTLRARFGHVSYRQSTGALHYLLHGQVAAYGLDIRVRLNATPQTLEAT